MNGLCEKAKGAASAALVIALVLMGVVDAVAQTRIVAHRGYWDCEGSAQNSIAALRLADKIGVYGSEFDIHLAADDNIVVNHDPTVGDLRIESSTLEELRAMRLPNGEQVPTLDEYLAAARKLKTRLVLEVKRQGDREREARLVDLAVAAVKRHGLESRTEYISFSGDACMRLRELCPKADVYYLNGDWTPAEVKARGLTGIDYAESVFKAHPEWIGECQRLGLKVNVWTVNDLNSVDRLVKQGVDFITTNRPVEAMKLSR